MTNDTEGTTPLTEEERQDLIPSHITTREQLNELEQMNITEAEQWVFGRKHRDLISEPFVRKLHKRMFGQVWKWAGKLRTTDKNIGIDRTQIAVELRKLCDDVRYWLEHDTYDPDEVAVRFHHRLVFIHPFPNGNGRLARFMADLIVTQANRLRLTWGGSQDLGKTDEIRRRYIQALREADQGNYGPLLEFARNR